MIKISLNDCKIFYFDGSKTKKVLKFFSDRHRFFLLTNNTAAHKYNIHNHIPREYGHQLGSNLNVSSVPMFHGSRTSLITNQVVHFSIHTEFSSYYPHKLTFQTCVDL